MRKSFFHVFKAIAVITTFLPLWTLASEEDPVIVQSEKITFAVNTVTDELNHPWGMAELPNRDLLITERNGGLVRLTPNGLKVKILGLPKDVYQRGQGGFFDIALSPTFEQDNIVYLSYAEQDDQGQAGTTVIRAILSGDVLIDSEKIFSALPKRGGGRHFGSRLLTTKDHLYITLGDRGHRDRAQFVSDHLGGLIRLNLDGSVPIDNPFSDLSNQKPELFSYGHRNVQGITLGKDGTVWAHEHGPQGGDELNIVRRGINYGWPEITYGVNYGLGTKIGKGTAAPNMEQPVHYWVPSIAPSGMEMVESELFSSWQGDLLVGSLKFGLLVRLEVQNNSVVHEERMFDGQFGRVRDVMESRDGTILILTDEGNGELLRLTPQSQ